MSILEQFDTYLDCKGPAALVIRQHLMPVEGIDAVLFPATFAAGDHFPGGYNIDGDPDGSNVCLVDSVGSQANRMEPLFADRNYRHLVPQILVIAGEKKLNLLEVGHRAGDALVRCSELQPSLQAAFRAVLDGNVEPLAKIAPTSLVFGVWDSRDTQAKLPRLLASSIRAFDVRRLTRSAQFNPAVNFVRERLLDEPADKSAKRAYAERGFIHLPACGCDGGVIAKGGIRRDAGMSLAALRLLQVGDNSNRTLTLQRYILGLALTAFTEQTTAYLRQGCLLVLDPAKAAQGEFVEVHPTGERRPLQISHEVAFSYASETALAFGVGENQTVEFSKERARKDTKSKDDSRPKARNDKHSETIVEA